MTKTIKKEKWISWNPIDNFSYEYSIDSIIDDVDSFRITLTDIKDKTNKIQIIFDDSIYSYRSTDESYRRNTIKFMEEEVDCSKGLFFKVIENSEYLAWLVRESGEVVKVDIESNSLIHFVFVDSESFLDVVANYEPRIERI
jgi:hypothetical protein